MLDYTYGNSLTDSQRLRWMLLTKVYGGAKTFIPNRGQFDFAKAVGELVPKGKYVFLNMSANGVGKTTIVWNILLNIFYKNYNIYENVKDLNTGEEFSGFFNFPLYNKFPAKWTKNVWYVSNADSLRFVHEEMKVWAPPKSFLETEWEESKDGKTYISRVVFPETGWNVFYKTIDQDPQTYETANVSIIVFDEPPPQELYKAAIHRTRKGGFIMFAATPIFNAAWFLDEIIDKAKAGSPYHWYQQVDIFQNCVETAGEWLLDCYGRQLKGNLSQERINFIIDQTDPDELEARIYGRLQQLLGLVFKGYDQEKHFVTVPPRIFPRNWMYRFVLDPHDRKPPAASWYSMDQYGHIHKIFEYPSVLDRDYDGKRFVDIKDSGNFTIKDFVERFFEIEQELKIPPDRIQDIIDPNFGNKPMRNTGRLVFEEYELAMRQVAEARKSKRRYRFIRNVVDDLDVGHKILKEFLKVGNTGEPKYTIDKCCINTDLAYRRYKYKEQTDKQLETMGLSDLVEEKYKDFIDNDRYMAVLPWQYRPLPAFTGKIQLDYGRTRKSKYKIKGASRPEGVEGV